MTDMTTIFVVVVITFLFSSIIFIGFYLSEEKKEELEKTSLEELSCEIIYVQKNDMGDNYIFKNKITETLKTKWDEMDCSNPSSQYWRGNDWQYDEPIEKRITEFEKVKKTVEMSQEKEK